jgi:hypothetical protein
MFGKLFHVKPNPKRLLIVLLLALPAFAQKDFLTDTEIDRIREVQEPAARIKLYLDFAKQRLDQLQSLIVKNRSGRSAEVRQLLLDYTSIIEAIDTVTDDALLRKGDLTAVPAAITETERKFADQLAKLQAGTPRDLEMYDFELKEAIATTSDSMDLAGQDLSARDGALKTKAEQDKKQVADVNAAERKLGPASPIADKAQAAADDAAKPLRPPPTLYRPGEKPADPPK